MKRIIIMLLVTFLSATPVIAGEIFSVESTDIQIQAIPAGELIFPAMTNFYGTTSDVTINPDNWCFGSTSQTSFNWGDKIATNAFFSDVAETDGTSAYNVTLAIRLPSGKTKVIKTWTANFTGLTPGLEYDFCVAEFNQTPSSGTSGLAIPWGKSIIQVGGESVQGQLGTVTMY